MKKHILIGIFFFASSLVQSQATTTRPLTKPDEIAQVISAATTELLLITDTFRNETLADAIRLALLERGVPVFIVVPEDLVTDLSSYFGTLERAGASIHLQETTGAFLVVDRQHVIQGPMLSTLETAPQASPTMLISNTDYADQLAQRFIDAFEEAAPWTHEPQ